MVGAVASLLLTHNAALDEHRDQPAFLFAVAQAISSGSRKGLTLIEGLSVSCLHLVHHVAHTPLLLLGKNGAADSDADEDGDKQGVHACSFCSWFQVYNAVKFRNSIPCICAHGGSAIGRAVHLMGGMAFGDPSGRG